MQSSPDVRSRLKNLLNRNLGHTGDAGFTSVPSSSPYARSSVPSFSSPAVSEQPTTPVYVNHTPAYSNPSPSYANHTLTYANSSPAYANQTTSFASNQLIAAPMQSADDADSMDITSFLEKLREERRENMEKSWRKGMSSYSDFRVTQNIQRQWDEKKKRMLFQEVSPSAVVPASTQINTGHSIRSAAQSTSKELNWRLNAFAHSSGTNDGQEEITAVQKEYSSVIDTYVQHRVANISRCSFIGELQRLAEKSQNNLLFLLMDTAAYVIDERMIASISSGSQTSTYPKLLNVSHYADSYCTLTFNTSLNAQDFPQYCQYRKEHALRAKACLEDHYWKMLSDNYVHGSRSHEELVFREMYKRLASREKDTAARMKCVKINPASQIEDPIWFILFNFLRSGLIKQGGVYVRNHAKAFTDCDPTFTNVFEVYCNYMHEYANTTVDRVNAHASNMAVQRKHVRVYYSQVLKPNAKSDPFQMAIYQIIGNIDLFDAKSNSVVYRSDRDVMWLWLSCVYEGLTPQLETERFRLLELQKLMELQIDTKEPLRMAQIYLLAGRFERAVAHLIMQSPYKVEGFHLACALAHYGLLLAQELDQSSYNIIQREGSPEIGYADLVDFPRMVWSYIRSFRTKTDARMIKLAYVSLIHLYSEEYFHQKCYEMLADYVVACDDSNVLFDNGDLTAEKFGKLFSLNSSQMKENIGLRAAQIAEKTGNFLLARRIYERYQENVLLYRMLNRQLGVLLFRHSSEGNMELLQYVQKILENEKNLSVQSKDTFDCMRILFSMVKFYDFKSHGSLMSAYQCATQTGIIPRNYQELLAAESTYKKVAQTISPHMSKFLLHYMNTLYELYGTENQQYCTDRIQTHLQIMQSYCVQANTLVQFIGKLPGTCISPEDLKPIMELENMLSAASTTRVANAF